ncbi:MAG: cobalamin-dependent protein [Candidatus Nitrosocaldus sp.]|nr:cobalamin-dependent protein [Candidatus Nitrosocaldus sp.]MDW8275950.1 cobalamin-dependent protein [Candidatus Nitrosocaldus sp.]
MVYVRMKSIRGIRYAYLVESVWDRERKQPKQRTIRYLGRVDSISIEDIPEAYRSDPNVLKFLNIVSESRVSKGHSDDGEGVEEAQGQVEIILSEDNRSIIEMLSSGNVGMLMSIYKGFLERYRRKDVAMLEFYEQIIIPALNEVGQLWLRNELGIAMEHVCSNTTLGLIQMIEEFNSLTNGESRKGDVLICTPYGDLHSIPCKMVESILLGKGYRVHNIAPSTPKETVLRYMEEVGANTVIVSVTLSSRAKAAERLVQELMSRYGDRVMVVVGGRGSEGISPAGKGVIVVRDMRQLLSLL